MRTQYLRIRCTMNVSPMKSICGKSNVYFNRKRLSVGTLPAIVIRYDIAMYIERVGFYIQATASYTDILHSCPPGYTICVLNHIGLLISSEQWTEWICDKYWNIVFDYLFSTECFVSYCMSAVSHGSIGIINIAGGMIHNDDTIEWPSPNISEFCR